MINRDEPFVYCYKCDDFRPPIIKCTPTLAQYGTIVLAEFVCPICGTKAKTTIIDDDGLYPYK